MGNQKKTFEDRWAEVKPLENGCWEWTGSVNPQGYGMVYSRDDGVFKSKGAHRYIYENLVGPIPDGLVLDHTCHNQDANCFEGPNCPHRRCVNPAHLVPVTDSVNIKRGHGAASINAAKTHCPEGHEYTEDNTYVEPKGSRVCLTCRKATQQRYYDSDHGGDKKRAYARERMRKLRQDPEYKIKKNAWERDRYHRKKAEKESQAA